MQNAVLAGLIQDAEAVADVGVRLGKIEGLSLFTAIEEAKAALAASGSCAAEAARLQQAIATAVRQLTPITLSDIRSGWRPFQDGATANVEKVLFALLCFVVLFATAYVTQVYHRATLLYQTTLELEDSRGSEQAVRLFGLLKKNQHDVGESLTSGGKDFLYESFNKSLNDLTSMNVKSLAYIPMATASLCELDFSGRFYHRLSHPFGGQKASSSDALECYSDATDKYVVPKDLQASLDMTSSAPGPSTTAIAPAVLNDAAAAPDQSADASDAKMQAMLNSYFENLRNFTSSINVAFDPLYPRDYSYFRFRFEQSLILLGNWILPGLYGMLGAIIFLMRRILDPALPSPTWLRFPFRIIMGGFAGIIVAWIWSPSPNHPSLPAFASLGAFGLAFIIGYSTDFFFLLLDRIVNYLSQAVTKTTPT